MIEKKCMEHNLAGAIRAFVASRSDIKPIHGFCEFIDNSLSAGASNIEIRIDGKKWSVTDDGCGTLYPDVILTPFVSRAMDATSRYGVGAACSIIILSHWGRCEVDTVTGDGVRSVCVMDWSKYDGVSTGDVELTSLMTEPSDLPQGTTIRIDVSNASWKPRLGELVDKLQFLYAGALRSDVRIVLKKDGETIELVPWPAPKLKKSLRKSLVHPEWGKVQARIGIVADGVANPHAGINLYWGKRILLDSDPTMFSMRDVGSARAYGEVFLDHTTFHHVNTAKDGFSPNFDSESLWTWLAEEFSEIIDAAATEAVQIQSTLFNVKVQGTLDKLMGIDTGKEKRKKSADPTAGTVKPTETGRKRATAEQIHDVGDVVRRSSVKGLPFRTVLVADETMDTVIKAVYSPKFWECRYNPSLLNADMRDIAEVLAYSIFGFIAREWERITSTDSRGQRLLPFAGDYTEIFTSIAASEPVVQARKAQ